MPHQADYRLLWIIGVIVAPPVLVLIELFHPAGFTATPGMFEFLREAQPHTAAHKALDYFGPDWWFWLHMIQTPLVCLIAVGLVLTVTAVGGAPGRSVAVAASSWAARIAVFIFAVYYTALDAIGGIGLGRTLQLVNQLATQTQYLKGGEVVACTDSAGGPAVCLNDVQVEGVALVLNQSWIDPWVGGVGSIISLTGSWAIFIAAVLIALTIVLARGVARIGALRWTSLVCLIAGGWIIQVSHACCTGPLGFGLIFLFGCLTWWVTSREARPRTSA